MKTKDKLTEEVVYSPVKDDNIHNNLDNSPIWNDAYTEEEYHSFKDIHMQWFKYTIKFDGLNPVQLTKLDAL